MSWIRLSWIRSSPTPPRSRGGRCQGSLGPSPATPSPEAWRQIRALSRTWRGSRGSSPRTHLAPTTANARRDQHARAGSSHQRLADACGALLATSAAARGLFRGSPSDLGISGGFASPLAAELIRGADLIVGWGCALNMWTMRHGTLVGPDTAVVQVDLDAAAIGAHQRANLGVLGDVAAPPGQRRTRQSSMAGLPRPVTGRRGCVSGSRVRSAGGMSRSGTRATVTASTRARCRSGSMTCCPPSAWWRSIQAASWATRACTCRSPTRTASASPRRPGFPPASRSRWVLGRGRDGRNTAGSERARRPTHLPAGIN